MTRRALAIFDLGWYAPTFDIFEFALNARAWAHQHGIPRIKLVILRRSFGDALVRQPQLPHDYDFRLHDILLGSSSLLPVDEVEFTADVEGTGAAADADRDHVFPPGWSAQLSKDKLLPHRYYLERFLRDYLATGRQWPGIRIPPAAFLKIAALLEARPRPWISITVRHTPYQQARNSNPATWQALREHFERRGASVMLIPDVERPQEIAAAPPLAAMAAANVVYRAALCDACDLNLAAVGGGISAAIFNPSAVHVTTKFGTEGSNSSPQRMRELLDMGPGSPMFYRMPWQQALWENDDDPGRLIGQAQAMLDFVASLREVIRNRPALRDPWGKPDGTLHGHWSAVRAGMSVKEIERALGEADASFPSSPFSCKRWMAEAERGLASGDLLAALNAAKQSIRLDGRYARPYVVAAECLRASQQDALADRYLLTAQELSGKK